MKLTFCIISWWPTVWCLHAWVNCTLVWLAASMWLAVLLPVRMSPPGFFSQDRSRFSSITGMNRASPLHTYLPPCRLPYMALQCMLSPHSVPPSHWFLSSLFVSVLFFFFFFFKNQPLNAPPVSNGKSGEGASDIRREMIQVSRSSTMECFFTSAYIFWSYHLKCFTFDLKGHLNGGGGGYRPQHKYRGGILISSLDDFPTGVFLESHPILCI